MDFLRKLKLILYFIAMVSVLILGWLAEKTGDKTKMMLIALAVLFVCICIFKLAKKYFKNEKEV